MAWQLHCGTYSNRNNFLSCSSNLQFYSETFVPELSIDEIPAHRFLKSIHNITIERGWAQLKFQFDVNVDKFWDEGILNGIYNPNDDRHWYTLFYVCPSCCL
jgi:hypothetical protein